MILVLDNYDSFTFNLVHYLIELGAEVEVVRADAVTAAEALGTGARAFLISPGPGRPEAAGYSLDLVGACAEAHKPLLGVCLGHQAIGQAFGGKVVRAPRVMHGKTSPVEHDGSGLFRGIPSPMQATRYHSLVVEPSSLPDALAVTARTAEGEIMALQHKTLPVWGVQFHPESILTVDGKKLLRNFLEMDRAAQ